MERVFDKNWFLKHQHKLKFLLNSKLTRRWFRWVLRIRKYDISLNQKIDLLLPNGYHSFIGLSQDGKPRYSFDIRTHDKYAKRLYFAFKWVWATMHFLDFAIDKYAPRFSFGFASFGPFYPSTGTPLGNALLQYASTNDTWANIRDTATGTTASVPPNDDDWCRLASGSTSGKWSLMTRSVFTFDTSSIGSGATIDSAVLSGWATTLATSFSQSIGVYSTTLANGHTAVTSDYDATKFGTTAYASTSLGSLSTGSYSDFTLDASGRGQVNPASTTAFGIRLSGDASNTEPTWSSSANARFFAYFADQTGTTNDPKLTGTYTAAAGADGNMFFFF